MQIPWVTRQSFTLILFLIVMSVVPHGVMRLSAQAVPLREKKADLSVFGTYTRLTPDYGPQQNNGTTFGVFYTRYWHWFSPAVEFRVKIADGETVDEKTYGGGVRIEKSFGRFRPYGDFLISAGSINYHFRAPPIKPNGQPYLSDSSVVYTYGGGLDFDLSDKFSARGEFQGENWSLGGYTPITLTPTMWSIGVVYRIPFRPIGFR
jgi:hypothetical protein